MSNERNLLRESLAVIERLKARLDESVRASREPIAIVGLGCRYPGGVEDLEGLWRVIANGTDAVREVPPERWDIDAFYDPDPKAAGKMVTRRAGMLDQVDRFDPGYFGISPREACALDPQQRLLLETSVEAFDSAAIATDKLAGSAIGVFIGASTNDYGRMMWGDAGEAANPYAATGGALNALSGRVAFTFGLQGPCITIDTACSSGLAAVHLACQALRSGECDVALAGGVNVILLPDAMALFSRWGMLAPDGRSKTFDAQADGMVRAEGCGVVVLKKLSAARAAGDPIRAVILGSAVNSDGRSSGLTVPSGPAQEAVLRAALAQAGVAPADVDYVEAHGTGTPLGDPIEVGALGGAYGPGRAADRPLIIGAAKVNFGHSEAASGILGLLKVVAALEHESIPAQINFCEPNLRIDWANLPVKVAAAQMEWRRGGRKRRAGVSAFGFSGTNTHVVMEEAPPEEPPAPAQDAPMLAPLSAHTEEALRQLAMRHAEALSIEPTPPLADVAVTLARGRAHLPKRLAVVAGSTADLATKLRAYACGGRADDANEGSQRGGAAPRVAFVFTGQGAQYAQMGRGLYDSEPVFRDILDRADASIGAVGGKRLLEAIFPIDHKSHALDETEFTQPALFVLEVALAELWRSWGVTPAFVLGHSVGEYAAACVAGAFSFEEGLGLIAERARLMQALPKGGAMAALFLSEHEVAARIERDAERISIAGLNGPEETVISGDADAVDAVLARAEADGVGLRRLEVSHAFHSHRLEPMLDPFEARAGKVRYVTPRIPLVSNLTGEILRQAPEAAYWRRHARAPVRFAASLEVLRTAGIDALVEIGPHPILLSLIGRAMPDAAWLSAASLREGRDDRRQMLEALGKLFAGGASPNWDAVLTRSGGRRLILPSYPFQRERHWIAQDERRPKSLQANDAHPLLGRRRDVAALRDTFIWESEISPYTHPWLADNKVWGNIIVPATAYHELAFAAGAESFGTNALSVGGADNKKPIVLRDGETRTLQTLLVRENGEARFEVASRPDSGGAWVTHVGARIRPATAKTTAPEDLATLRRRCVVPQSGADFYAALAQQGNQWGPSLQGVEKLWLGDHEALAEVRVVAPLAGETAHYHFHPAVSDACGHVLVAALEHERRDEPAAAYVGGGVEETRFYQRPSGDRLWTHARIRPEAGDRNVVIGDVTVFEASGTVVSVTLGARLWYLDERAGMDLAGAPPDWFYQVRWRALQGGTRRRRETTEGIWLVLSDGSDIAGKIAAARTKAGRRTIVGVNGQAYALADDRATVRWGRAQDIQQILQTVAPVEAVVHLSCADPVRDGDDVGGVASACIESVLTVLRGMQEAKNPVRPRLWLVTSGAQAVKAREACAAPWRASLWGLGKTLATEHGELWGGLVDLECSADSESAARQLLSEVGSADGEDKAAYRGGTRYLARLQRWLREPQKPFAVHADASYLITGGLGGLGLVMARWLAEHGARRLLLVGRTSVPARANWGALDPASNEGRRTAALLDIEALGAEIECAALDIAAAGQLDALLGARAERGVPPVRGVIHAAGVLAFRPLLSLDAAALREALSAKIDGGWRLHKQFGEGALDFLVFCSSTSALLNSPMLGAYAAGNAFLDALAHHRQALGLPALSINWSTWGEAGMAKVSGRASMLSGMETMSNAAALAALAELIMARDPQVCVMPVDWAQFAAAYPAFSADPFLRDLVGAGKSAGAPRSKLTRAMLATLPALERSARLRTHLLEQAARVLGLEPARLDCAMPLLQSGFDSLMAVQLKNQIEADLGVVVPMIAFLQGPSIDELTLKVLAVINTAPAAVEDTPLLEWEEGTL